MNVKDYLYLVIVLAPACLLLAAAAFTFALPERGINASAPIEIAVPGSAPRACAEAEFLQGSDVAQLHSCIVL